MCAKQKGFTLIELLAGMAVFAILAVGVLGALGALFQSVKANRERVIVSTLASQRLEIVRNLPYSQVGTASGNPTGQLPDEANPFTSSIEGSQYHVYYEVTYIDDPADGTIVLGSDPAPADYKQVKMFVKNVATGRITSFLTSVVPKGLEGTSNAGALLAQVFDSVGQPVVGANVYIENLSVNPQIILNRTTDSSGKWIEVGLPSGVNAYHVVVTKSGYSTDQTYPITQSNLNPIKPDATIVVGQVTQVSFAIDLLANLTVHTQDALCQGMDGVGLTIKGSKLIGNNPDVLKFDQNFISVSGQVNLSNIEWDIYTPNLQDGSGLVLLGTSPIQQISVLPGGAHVFNMILANTTTNNSLLVIVKDAATGAAIEGVSVHLRKGGSQPQDYYGTTGGSTWKQYDWTGGSGQAAFTATDRYWADNGNIDINSVPTGTRLLKVTGNYVSPGNLESSTFDSGTAQTAWTNIMWLPTSQDPSAILKFQLASSSSSSGPWTYLGPDGTNATFYTVPGEVIASTHNNKRYLRYKVFLETSNDKKTPVLTSLNINYVSGCYTPGQVSFYDLTAGQNYDIDVTATGYQTYVESGLNISEHETMEILMSP